MYTIPITLGISSPNHQQVVVMQGDYTSIQVQANFVDATGTQINISGKTIYFQCYKNGQSITLDTPAVSGDGLSAIAAILPSACATSGELSGEFQIVDEEGGKKVPPFKIMVLSSPDDAMQTTDFKVLTEKLGDVNSAVADVNKAVSDANAAITNMNTTEQSITTAESSRTTAEGRRVIAENDRVVTEQDRVIAENDRGTAENNRKAAETQRQTDTTTAITNAEAATNNANHVPQRDASGVWKDWDAESQTYQNSTDLWKGEKGDTGPSFECGESYSTLAELQSAYPSGDAKGHLAGQIAYIWDGSIWKPTNIDLSEYIKTTVADAKYASINHTHTAAQVHARADDWMPTAAEVGARPATWTPTAAEVGAAGKSTSASVTLTAASWTGDTAPYVQTVSIANVTATSNQEFLPALDITADQLTALQSANIVDGGQTAGSVTLKAYGDKPTIDIPLRVIVRGDM